MIQARQTRAAVLADGVDRLRNIKRDQQRVDSWFYVQELRMKHRQELIEAGGEAADPVFQAELLCRVAGEMPLSIPAGSAIAGSQDAAFSPSYALINPSFRVDTFAGYCDPTAIYNDLEPDESAGLTDERIKKVRDYWEQTPYVKELQGVYAGTGLETKEVVYFIEPVTGHTIPDLRPFLRDGVRVWQVSAARNASPYARAMARSLDAVLILADRYRRLAIEKVKAADDPQEKALLKGIVDVLDRVPAGPAENLHQAVQMFALLWQAMVIEQSPNPYAFSVGNLDRILSPYFDAQKCDRDEAVALVRHLLAFFQVGSRCWAISQNIMVGGRDAAGKDVTSDMTSVVLDAFFESNDPQPALSVKVHAGTPRELFGSLGRFFFTPGHSTPSLFNDDSMLPMLKKQGIAEEDLADYSIAGCQEPLIMGRSSLNTTNTWLNLAKVLELAANDGKSLISGSQLGPTWQQLGINRGQQDALGRLEEVFMKMLDHFLPRMTSAGNACTDLLGRYNPVPLTSCLMDSFSTWRDMRDPTQPGTRYNGSGCLIHGLSVVANSLHAAGRFRQQDRWDAGQLRSALADNFKSSADLRKFLLRQEKFGNNSDAVDSLAVRIASIVSDKVRSFRNTAGNAFLADWSTPSTHLLYGYWVGATPDGRPARQMLGYGLDPLVETVGDDLPARLQSAWKLPYHKMTGGYASHIGLRPADAAGKTMQERGLWLRDEVVEPLFRWKSRSQEAPFYVYFNIDDVGHLRKVLADPKKYAPNGIYILRIHGTFVNFLDLSPAIQDDIMRRLELSGASK